MPLDSENWGEEEVLGPDVLVIPIRLDMKQAVQNMIGNPTLTRYIVDQTAKLLAKELLPAVKDIVAAQIDLRVGEIITEALNGTINSTNGFGEARTAPPKTLREMVVDEAKAWLSKPIGDAYARNRSTHFQKYLTDTIDNAFKRELGPEIDKAKNTAKQHVADTAAQVIAEKIVGK